MYVLPKALVVALNQHSIVKSPDPLRFTALFAMDVLVVTNVCVLAMTLLPLNVTTYERVEFIVDGAYDMFGDTTLFVQAPDAELDIGKKNVSELRLFDAKVAPGVDQ
jgi:hypothetical protein